MIFLNNLYVISCWPFNQTRRQNIYSRIKTHYKYETYLTLHYFTKFRLSNHYLPIEKGRYVKPKLNRNQRICTFCKSHVGDELHVLFECEHGTIKNQCGDMAC